LFELFLIGCMVLLTERIVLLVSILDIGIKQHIIFIISNTIWVDLTSLFRLLTVHDRLDPLVLIFKDNVLWL